MGTKPIIELFSPQKVDQIASVNVLTWYSTTDYLVNS